jgi:hypothetical protein
LWVGIESDCHCAQAAAARLVNDVFDKQLVAAMNTVKAADRHHRAEHSGRARAEPAREAKLLLEVTAVDHAKTR